MRNKAFVIMSLIAFVPGSPAKADFRLQGTAPDISKTTVVGPAGPRLLAFPDAAETGGSESAQVNMPRVLLARGFGHAVPLSFAARQIVPRNVAIRFGADVDQTLLVDWSGGRPWNIVMDAAVRPLHLHLTFTRASVLIS